ncbi:proline-rich protein 2-like [Sagmatias obliquidens]|uniref:proline-rich protein 2-like n=1 Tax=Sagmatias obliquidens TaxID=3371155 RepID=UPI000F444476|nr:proline-rich protein 2-like [Lagenorhynchus obliquidens]
MQWAEGGGSQSGEQVAARVRANSEHRRRAAPPCRRPAEPGPGLAPRRALGGSRRCAPRQGQGPAVPGRGAAPRQPGAPGPPGGRKRAASAGENPGGLAPPQPVTYLGAEQRRGEEPAAEGRGPSRRRGGLPCPPPAHPAGPLLPEAQGRAANRKGNLREPGARRPPPCPSAGKAPAAAGGQVQPGSPPRSPPGPKAFLTMFGSSQTSSPAGTCPKERFWGQRPQTGDLLPGAELTHSLLQPCALPYTPAPLSPD